jgi:hydrogenase large subunit
VWNAFERNRGQAYAVVYEAMEAYDNWLTGMDLLKRGEDRTATPYAVPQDHRMGLGFWGAGRGWLAHHLELDKGAIVNYQIVTPSTVMACPWDPWGNPGPYEEAVLSTPILEGFDKRENYKGIDYVIAVFIEVCGIHCSEQIARSPNHATAPIWKSRWSCTRTASAVFRV